jgi:hypothetical protein
LLEFGGKRLKCFIIRFLTFIVVILLILNIIFLKSTSINDSTKEYNANNNSLPISSTSNILENPSKIEINEKDGYSYANQPDEENELDNYISRHKNNATKVYPILPNIYEINGNFIDNQNQENNDQVNNISFFTSITNKKAHIMQNINKINGYFTENHGQVGDDSVRYYIHGAGVWFLDDGVVFELRENVEKRGRGSEARDQGDKLLMDPMVLFEPLEPVEYRSVVIKMEFDGANLVTPRGKNRLSWNNNYFYGNNSSKWCTDVPNYQEIIYKNLYEHIDLRYYMNEKGLKYDFIVHPNSNPNEIKIRIDGANNLYKDNNENLNIKTELGSLIDSNLNIYQNIKDDNNIIRGNFKIISSNTYGFEIFDDYNKNIDLIIDPFLNYSTYIGGNKTDFGFEIEVDSEGNAYISGTTASLDFPTTVGAYDNSYNNGTYSTGDVFISKLNSNGTSLIYSSYIGGIRGDFCDGLSVDDEGNTFLTGHTSSSNFPTTNGAYDTSFNGGGLDVFILKLNKTGSSLYYSTYIGGNGTNRISGTDHAYEIKIDSFSNAYVSGSTWSSDFPITVGAYDTQLNGSLDVFVLKLNSIGTTLLYSTFIGGNQSDVGNDIVVDKDRNVFVTGLTTSSDFPVTPNSYDSSLNGSRDCFVFKLNQNGSNLLYATYIGGNNLDIGMGIDIDKKGNTYVTGVTYSSDFPVTNGAYDATYNDNSSGSDGFILKLNTNGSALIYSTYIGGKLYDQAWDIEVDTNENVYVTGLTFSSNFPTTFASYDNTHNGNGDVFVLMLNQNGSILNYSSFIGGTNYEFGIEIELDKESNIFITGYTFSSDFPISLGSFDSSYGGVYADCFVLKHSFDIINNPPIVTSFTATTVPEGSKVIFTVDATDPENDTLTYSFDFQNDGKFDLNTSNNSTSFIWGDDYIGIATVLVSDGNLNTKAKTSVIVYNVPPKLQLKVSSTNQSTKSASTNLSIRIAGEKWHDVKVELYKNGNEITNGSLIRYPGSPNEQMLHLLNQTLDSTFNWTAILYYTPNDDPINGKPNGATPCWVILNLSNGKQIKIHHTFKVKHTDTHIWRVNLTELLPSNGNSSRKWTFNITVFDPGADDIILYLDFGDGTNITKFYPNNNQTYPVSINVTLSHDYTSGGTFSVILIAQDDDGGITTVKVSIDFG